MNKEQALKDISLLAKATTDKSHEFAASILAQVHKTCPRLLPLQLSRLFTLYKMHNIKYTPTDYELDNSLSSFKNDIRILSTYKRNLIQPCMPEARRKKAIPEDVSEKDQQAAKRRDVIKLLFSGEFGASLNNHLDTNGFLTIKQLMPVIREAKKHNIAINNIGLNMKIRNASDELFIKSLNSKDVLDLLSVLPASQKDSIYKIHPSLKQATK